MLIYRIEDKYGKGAFRGLVNRAMDSISKEDNVFWFGETGEPDPRRHPDIEEDGGFSRDLIEEFDGYQRGHAPWFFGFESMDSLVVWFDSERLRCKMKELGGKVVIYFTEDFHKGNTQVMFRMSTAEKIKEIEIPTLT